MTDKELEEKINLIAKHKLNNHLTNIGFDAADFISENKLMKQRTEYIERDVGEIKKMLSDFIKTSDNKFATKADVKDKNKLQDERIDKYDNMFLWGGRIIWAILIVAILGLILK